MRATVSGVDIAYEDAGRGVPLLLVHGFPLDRTMWAEQVAALAGGAGPGAPAVVSHATAGSPAGPRARVIAPDLRGFGESAAPRGPVSIETYARDAAALLDHLGIERAVVGGLSMGGYVAFAFARLWPRRVRALLLCDTRAAADTAEARRGRFDMIDLVQREGPAAVAERMLPRLFAAETFEGRPEIVERTRVAIERASVEGIAAALGALADRPDATPSLPAIACPTLFVVGEHDAIAPPAEAAAIVAEIPDARLLVVPHAGHMAPLENPGAVNAALQEFLRGLGEEPRA